MYVISPAAASPEERALVTVDARGRFRPIIPEGNRKQRLAYYADQRRAWKRGSRR